MHRHDDALALSRDDRVIGIGRSLIPGLRNDNFVDAGRDARDGKIALRIGERVIAFRAADGDSRPRYGGTGDIVKRTAYRSGALRFSLCDEAMRRVLNRCRADGSNGERGDRRDEQESSECTQSKPPVMKREIQGRRDGADAPELR